MPGMSNGDDHLWREVVNLAQDRDGTYDTGAIVAEIEATFGPSSIREVPDQDVERLFEKHRIDDAGDQ
jgi:hypothetical protein